MATLPQLVTEPRSSVFLVVVTVVVIVLGMRISLPFEAEDQFVGSISYQELLIHKNTYGRQGNHDRTSYVRLGR